MLVTFGFGLVLHVVSFSVNVLAADRFLYLPLVGLTLLSTSALAALDLPRSAGILAALLVASFGLVTFRRANIWSDEVSLWVASLGETREDPSLSYIELGRMYSRAGLFTEALSIESKGSSPRFDGYAVTINNAAAVLARAGQYKDARRLLAPIARSYPNVPGFNLSIALFESYMGHFAAARARLADALAVYPTYLAARALILALPALEQKRRMLDALPEGAELLDRARLSAQLGLGAEAVAAWRRAVDRGGLGQNEFREGLWFTLDHGDAETVASMCHAYSAAFASGRDHDLDLVCETRADLVKRLRAAWPTLAL
jgi:tetratricopeptide (TPR) repeat protein